MTLERVLADHPPQAMWTGIPTAGFGRGHAVRIGSRTRSVPPTVVNGGLPAVSTGCCVLSVALPVPAGTLGESVMAREFRAVDRETPMLLPPDLREWLAGGSSGLPRVGSCRSVRLVGGDQGLSAGWDGAGGVRSGDADRIVDLRLLAGAAVVAADRAGLCHRCGDADAGGAAAAGPHHDRPVPEAACGRSGRFVRDRWRQICHRVRDGPGQGLSRVDGCEDRAGRRRRGRTAPRSKLRKMAADIVG